MKCRACWAEAAEVCRARRWKSLLAACVLSVPVKCSHCYCEYLVPFWAVGKAARRRDSAHGIEPRHWPARTVISSGTGRATRELLPRKVA